MSQTELARRMNRPLKTIVEWLKEIPVKEMMQREWIPYCQEKTQQVLECFKY